jgi:hypothetical protein
MAKPGFLDIRRKRVNPQLPYLPGEISFFQIPHLREKPGFTTLVNKSSNTKKPKKPGFLGKRVNPQLPYLPR